MIEPTYTKQNESEIHGLLGYCLTDDANVHFTSNGLVVADPSLTPALFAMGFPLNQQYPSINDGILYVSARAQGGHYGYVYNNLGAGAPKRETILITTLDVIDRRAPEIGAQVREGVGEDCGQFQPGSEILADLLDAHANRLEHLTDVLKTGGYRGVVAIRNAGSRVGEFVITGNGVDVLVLRNGYGLRSTFPKSSVLEGVRKYWIGIEEILEIPE